MPYVPTITNYTQLWWVPNVVVAHEKEGIEAVHLASGRTLCKVKIRYKKFDSQILCHLQPKHSIDVVEMRLFVHMYSTVLFNLKLTDSV